MATKKISISKESKMHNKQIPEGVWILSVLLFSGAVLSIFLALSMFNTANPLNYELIAMQSESSGGSIPVITFINLGLMFIVFGLISYFIGRGLIKLENRARIALIIVLVLGIAASIYTLIWAQQYYSSSYTIVLQLVALWYLLRRKTVKYFS